MISTRIKYGGRKVRLPAIRFRSYEMTLLATKGLAALKARVNRGLGSEDNRMPPLKRGYAIQKTRAGKGNIRNLNYSGAMLDNLTLRSSDDTSAKIALTQRKQRTKAAENERISSWLKWSPNDQAAIISLASKIFDANVEAYGRKFINQLRRAA